MKISPGMSISNNPSITLEPIDAEDASQGSQVRRSSGTSTPYVHTLVLNALAFSVAGSTILNRKNADGNYYTITFPDDFVSEINVNETLATIPGGSTVDGTSTGKVAKDPFYGYRADTAPYQIDTRLNVTIQIPPGMNVGTNSFAQFMSPFDMKSVYSDTSRNHKLHSDGTNMSSVQNNLRGFSADPCILINYGSHKVSTTTLQNSTLTIENSGNTIGGGGYGGFGGIVQSGKGVNKRGGGGGGGGMGIHQEITPGSVDPQSGQGSENSLLSTGNVFYTYATDVPMLDPSTWPEHASYSGRASQGASTPRPGQGGLAFWFWHGRSGGTISGAANGEFSNSTYRGAGGAGSAGSTGMQNHKPSSARAFTVTEAAGGNIRGGAGGNVIQFKSNASGTFTGSSIHVVNKSTGHMRGGAGGGGGGSEGGAGGQGGSFYDSGSYNTGRADGQDGLYATTRNQWGGFEGQIILNASANVTVSNTFSNERSDNNWMQGRDIRVT